jgi:peptidoglycan L-alanyl-D-glutamate endopeptidase CwlK
MINSRNLDDLHPIVRDKAKAFLAKSKDCGIDLLVTSTYRDNESQAALYAQGRTKPGNIVTNAKPGQSWHNWRCAFDVVPLRFGKPVWATSGKDGELWRQIGEIGESVGLEWAGRWTGKLREMAHFQYTAGLTLADFKSGKTLGA